MSFNLTLLYYVHYNVTTFFQVCFSCALTSGPLQNLLLQITQTAEQDEHAD